MSTMGSQLAHGISKRNIREGIDDWQEEARALFKKHAPGRTTRAAVFRSRRKVLIEAFKDRCITNESVGKQDGKDKKGVFWLLGWLPCTVARPDAEDISILISSITLESKNPQYHETPIAEITNHCLARIYQTYRTDDFSQFVEKEKRYLVALMDILQGFIDGLDKTATYALATTTGILLLQLYQDGGVVQLKTAISYEAMTPVKADKLKRKVEKGDVFWIWKEGQE